MTDYEAFVMYMCLARHFEGRGYDYFKYKGKMKSASWEVFSKRPDGYFFYKLSKMIEVRDFLVANFHNHGNVWVGHLVQNESYIKTFNKWKGYRSSFLYNFKSELEDKTSLKSLINFSSGNDYPELLQLCFGKEVSAETILAIDKFTGCLDYWNKRLSDDIIWNDVYQKIKVYKPFFVINDNKKEKIKKILIDIFA